MSVSTWNRNDSKMIFLSKTLELSEEVTLFLGKIPTKYRMGIGDAVAKEMVIALREGKLANSIYSLGTKNELYRRQEHLQNMKASIDTVATFVSVLAKICNRSDGMCHRKAEQMQRSEQKIGKLSVTIIKCIVGLISSDIDRWNDAHTKNKINKKWRMHAVLGNVQSTVYQNNNSPLVDPEEGTLSATEFVSLIDKAVGSNTIESVEIDNIPPYDFSKVEVFTLGYD